MISSRKVAVGIKRFAQSARPAIAVLTAVGLLTIFNTASLSAQETSTYIFGAAPANAVVMVHGSSNGMRRHTSVNAKGHYTINSLPVGVYDVSLQKDGKVVDTRANVSLTIGRGTEVDFACPNDHCAEQ